MTIQNIVEEAAKKPGGIQSVFFVACGGSYACQYPAKYMLETEAKNLRRVGLYSSNEFVHATPGALGENSLVVAISYAGNTPESVEAAGLAKKKGATVVTLSKNPESALCQNGHHTLTYDFDNDERDWTKSVGILVLSIAAEVLRVVDNWEKYDDFVASVARYHTMVNRAREFVQEDARKWAAENAREKRIYTLGSGPAWGAAYQQSICIYMEMQWIHSSCIHTGEFFHGPFEITDTETSFLVYESDGKTRPLDERAITFLKKYGRKVKVLDVKNLGLNVLEDSVSEYFSGLLINNVIGIYNQELAVLRNHPLSTRRYMWQFAY